MSQARQISGHVFNCVLGGIAFVSLYDFSIGFLELFRQCGIFGTVPTLWYFWNCSDLVVFLELFRPCGIFGTVPTLWYFWNGSDLVVFLERFRPSGIFGTVPTVWYFLFFTFYLIPRLKDNNKYLV
jgi:hypothetical protein